MIRNLLALTGVIALVLISAVTLQAQGYFDDFNDADPPQREAVSFSGLDLTSAAGISALETRINAAIDRICPDDATRLKQAKSVRQCRDDAIASVRPQVDRAVAAAEERGRYTRGYSDRPTPRPAYRWRVEGPPPPEQFAARPPAPAPRWDGEDERGWRADRPDFHVRPPAPPPAAGKPIAPSIVAPKNVTPQVTAKVAAKAPPPPPRGRLVKRTVVTTTVTTTTTTGGAGEIPAKVRKTVIVKHASAPKWQGKTPWRGARAPAYARRPAVAGSWLPPVAWAASDRAAISAFRTGTLAHWRLTDRNGIARTGYVTVGAPRWVAGSPCRNVQTVKYHGKKQIVVAAGMRCLAGRRLVNRAA